MDIFWGEPVWAGPPPLRVCPRVGRGTTTATQPARRVTWRPCPSHGDSPGEVVLGRPVALVSTTAPHPPPDPCPKVFFGSGDVAGDAVQPRGTPRHRGRGGGHPQPGSTPHRHPPRGVPGRRAHPHSRRPTRRAAAPPHHAPPLTPPLHPPRNETPLLPTRGSPLPRFPSPLSFSHPTTSRPPSPPRGARRFRRLLAHAGPPSRRGPGGRRTPSRPGPRFSPR